MRSQSVVGYGAAGFLIVVAQLLAGFGGAGWQLLAGVAGGLLTLGLLKFFEVGYERWWAPAVLAVAATAVGTGISLLASPTSRLWPLAAVPLVAALAAGIPAFVSHSAARKCQLCGRPMHGEVSFDCPRCRYTVCDRCWRFESLRCRLCDDNKVPAFPADSRWWREQLGEPVSRGRCQVCQVDTTRDTLYACPRCGRMQCRTCWDYTNGQCRLCEWLIEDLPPAIDDLMVARGRRG